jgi:hypothetical protein
MDEFSLYTTPPNRGKIELCSKKSAQNLFDPGGTLLSPYGIILALFTLSGLAMTLWGWFIIARGRKSLRWPSVDGVVEQSLLASPENDILPKIVFSYHVADRRYQRDLAVPGGDGVTPDFAESYVKKYPQGAKVQVHYNPQQPEQATLEPGPARDDWLIFSVGIGAALLGALFLIFK